MQFMNSSLEKLVQILPKDKFKYFSQNFFGKQLELVKQKGIYPYEYMKDFKNLMKENDVKKSYIVGYKMNILVIKIMRMQKKF